MLFGIHLHIPKERITYWETLWLSCAGKYYIWTVSIWRLLDAESVLWYWLWHNCDCSQHLFDICVSCGLGAMWLLLIFIKLKYFSLPFLIVLCHCISLIWLPQLWLNNEWPHIWKLTASIVYGLAVIMPVCRCLHPSIAFEPVGVCSWYLVWITCHWRSPHPHLFYLPTLIIPKWQIWELLGRSGSNAFLNSGPGSVCWLLFQPYVAIAQFFLLFWVFLECRITVGSEI